MAKQSVNRLSVPQFIPRYRVTLVSEGGHTAPYGVLRDSAAAAAALRPCFASLDREQFLVCCLDAKNVSIGVNIVSIGSLTLSIVHVREVFKPAILLNAAAIIAVITTRPVIPRRALRIGRSPHDCGKLETYWASGCSTISFSVTIVSIVLQIRAGRCEATAKVLSRLPVDRSLLEQMTHVDTFGRFQDSYHEWWSASDTAGRLKNRQHTEPARDARSFVRPSRFVHKVIPRRWGRRRNMMPRSGTLKYSLLTYLF
jgi:hypothetical protein